MTLEQKLIIFKEKGYTYYPESGIIRSGLGNIMTKIDTWGYIRCKIQLNHKSIYIKGHQLAWYLYYNQVPPSNKKNCIDHIDHNKSNNSIENLRIVPWHVNLHNQSIKKGYHLTQNGKYMSIVSIKYVTHYKLFLVKEDCINYTIKLKSSLV